MNEFKGKNKKDLIKTLSEKKADLQKFRFGSSGGRTKNVKEGYNLRKDIARIMTELHAQAMSEAVEAISAPKAEVKKETKVAKAKVVKASTASKAKVAKAKAK